MAYYYLTANKEIWKKVGARKVRMIYSHRPTTTLEFGKEAITLASNVVAAKVRKLRSSWNFVQWNDIVMDLKGMHGIDIDLDYVRSAEIIRNPYRYRHFDIDIFKLRKEIIFESPFYNTVWFELSAQE